MTPILIAADRTHYDLVCYLIVSLKLTREEIIEVEELLGASFLNKKSISNKKKGYSILLGAMKLRLELFQSII